MATLESGFNSTYSRNASILTGNPNRVTVEVENTIDRDFWSDLLGGLCPEKEFHFDPYQTIMGDGGKKCGKGKSKIIENSQTFNAWHIGCVDSDYDWILSDFLKDGKIISDSKYLIQTYAYSIENLMCLSSTLRDFCLDVTEEIPEFDFVDYLSRLSSIIYPLLVWSLYLYSKGIENLASSSLREVIVNTETNAEQSLILVKAQVENKLKEINQNYAHEIADKEIFERTTVAAKDVLSDTSYLYVRGHDIFDHLLTSVLNPIISTLRNSHYETLRSLDEDTRKEALERYNRKQKNVRKLFQKNYRYKNHTPLYDKIKTDISQIWI